MILKMDNDDKEIYMVEATGNRGVALNKWEYLRQHCGSGKFYEKVVFRHVDFPRTNDMVDDLEQFLKEAIGQRYGIGSKKLMNRRTVVLNRSGTNRQMIDEERTFFCSELMAKAFKVLGIMKDDGRSCS